MARNTGSAEATWLVWCFEHCLKPEQAVVRKELAALATRFGCKFVWHKKSMSFLRWLESRKGSILLVADWREAKPITEEISKQNKGHDLRMCVVAQTATILRRASFWARTQNGCAEVMVTPGFLRHKVEELIASRVQAVQAKRITEPAMSEITVTSGADEWLSLSSLLEAVQNPEQALGLEKLIRQTMWQLYED
ncbi:unnamed protein product [Symbiodinium microadriaticum]|nr:unnamed protein product [Symbiodinium microadriaticum]